MEYLTGDEDKEDNESNILSTNVDSPSNSLVIELWSCNCSSVVLHLRSDIFCLEDVVVVICAFLIIQTPYNSFVQKISIFLRKLYLQDRFS